MPLVSRLSCSFVVGFSAFMFAAAFGLVCFFSSFLALPSGGRLFLLLAPSLGARRARGSPRPPAVYCMCLVLLVFAWFYLVFAYSVICFAWFVLGGACFFLLRFAWVLLSFA